MKTILLTGFAPFGGETLNPSETAVRALAEAAPPGIRLHVAILPVAYATAAPALLAAVRDCEPDAVLATGLSGGRPHVAVERIAVNIDDARIADNDGVRRIDMPVVPGGPAAYFATLPIKAMTAAIRAAGIPAEVSQSAGLFLCNHIFYRSCHLAATGHSGMQAGFIHLPWLPEQATQHRGEPSMALVAQMTALRAALEAVRDTAEDLRVAEGATD